jgi:hypothetical protein
MYYCINAVSKMDSLPFKIHTRQLVWIVCTLHTIYQINMYKENQNTRQKKGVIYVAIYKSHQICFFFTIYYTYLSGTYRKYFYYGI